MQITFKDVTDESKPSFHKLVTTSCSPANNKFTTP